MSDRRTDPAALREQIAEAEMEIVDLERRITDAIVAKQPVGRLSLERHDAMEARDRIRERLARIEAEERGR